MNSGVPRRKPIPSAASQSLHPDNPYAHSRSANSSNTYQSSLDPPQQRPPPSHMQVHAYTSRRTPSQGTFSTIGSSGNGPLPYRQASQDRRTSTSSRSGPVAQPPSYVALMRKQKATVWCDRAQQEDPRLLAAQRAAKMRATMEVIGGAGTGRTSTSGSGNLSSGNRVTAKIRHHGKAGLVGYSPGDLVGGIGGVPMRLSASEVEGGDSDDDADSGRVNGLGPYHQRSHSGRSSIGSGGRRGLTYSRQSGASSTAGRWSSGNTPPDPSADASETPVSGTSKDYFPPGGNRDGTRSAGSGSSGERADNVGELGSADAARLASNSLMKATITREKSVRNPEELRRRGSVDDRTMTMSHGRLYIANPDADSD